MNFMKLCELNEQVRSQSDWAPADRPPPKSSCDHWTGSSRSSSPAGRLLPLSPDDSYTPSDTVFFYGSEWPNISESVNVTMNWIKIFKRYNSVTLVLCMVSYKCLLWSGVWESNAWAKEHPPSDNSTLIKHSNNRQIILQRNLEVSCAVSFIFWSSSSNLNDLPSSWLELWVWLQLSRSHSRTVDDDLSPTVSQLERYKR